MNPIGREKSRGAVLAVGLLTLAITAANAVRVLFSPLQEVIKAALHLSDYQIGLVQGVAASIPIALLSVPVGRQTDRGNRAHLLIILAAASAAGTLMTVVVTNFWPLFIARMLAGLAAGCALPVIISIAADLCHPARRGRTLLFLSVGNMTGGALAFALGGWLLALLSSANAPAILRGMPGWRSVHLVFGALDVAVVAAGLSLPAAFFPLMPTALGFELMLALLLLCGSITGLVTATAIAILVHSELRGIVLGAFMVVGAVIGLAIAPLLVTVISSALGGENHVGVALTATSLATSAVALVGFLSAMRSANFRPVTLQ